MGVCNLQISQELKINPSSVKYWLKKRNLQSNGTVPKKVEMIDENQAKCSKCKKILPISGWPTSRDSRYSHHYYLSYCKTCKQNQYKKWVNKNPLKFLRYMYHSIKQRCPSRNLEFSISIQEIESIYKIHSNICFYTGHEMRMEKGSGASPNSLSFDRIDISKGYVPGNVVFCRKRINTMKGNMTLEEMKEWTPGWYKKVQMYRDLGLVCLDVGRK